jgi:aminoglycoside/choline kinase family phosphotransferase
MHLTLLLRSYTALSKYYHSTGNNDSIVKYQALMIKIKDSLFNDKQAQQFQNIDFDEEQRQQQVETAKKVSSSELENVFFAGRTFCLLIHSSLAVAK